MMSKHAAPSPMAEDDRVLDEVAATVHFLVTAEMQVQHQLGYHEAPAEECPVCRLRAG